MVVTGYAPYLVNVSLLDSIYNADTRNWQRKAYKSWVMRKLRNEHLVEVREPDFTLRGDVVLNLEAGRDQKETPQRTLYTNTRGYQLSGTIGKRLFFNTSFYETQSVFPNYMDSLLIKRKSVPGYGRFKDFNTSSNYNYDYAFATGSVGYALRQNTFLQFGHDRQFVGYGYRSLLLSDASAPYPFLRAQAGFWKNRITYTTTWAVLQTLDRVSATPYNDKEAMFLRLGAKFNYLHIQPLSWFGIGLFDGTTWLWANNNHPRSIEYYMPYGWVYQDATAIISHVHGINAFVRPVRILTLYGQWASRANGSGQGKQFGLRITPVTNLEVQAEYNQIGLGLYYQPSGLDTGTIVSPSQLVDKARYYQHNNQPLGHPVGQGVTEVLFKVRYRLRDFFVSASIHQIDRPVSTIADRTFFMNTEGGYIINPKSNTQLVVGIIQREQGILETRYAYFAFRTALINRYLDF